MNSSQISPAPPSLINHFALLPDEAQLYLLIYHLHHSADVIHFAATSKNNYMLFQNNVNSTLLRPGLNHTALGEYNPSEHIYHKDKTILTMKGTTAYHPGRYRYINQTSFQIALRNAEFKKAEMIGMHLTDEEKQKQFDEIFPDGQLISHGCDLATAKLLLENVFNAIAVDDVIKKHHSLNRMDDENYLNNMTDKTRTALQQLRDAVNPENYYHCQTGLVFDARIYLQVLKRHNGKASVFETWAQHTFWYVRVKEMIASCLPTRYLRPHCQGTYTIQVDGKALQDGCRMDNGQSPYFSFLRAPRSHPGLHFYIDIHGHRSTFCSPNGFFYKNGRTFMKELWLTNTARGESLRKSICSQKQLKV